MDLDIVRQRMNELTQNKKSSSKEKKDYTKIYWKPREAGEFEIRIVPSVLGSELPTNPFQEIYVHYNITQYPALALTNWGEKDPIVEFAKKLDKSGDIEKWKLGKQLMPKLRAFVPVVVRGEESKGVRLFEMSKTLYLEFLGYLTKKGYGDFTDVNDGYDFILTAVKKQNGKGFDISLAPQRNNSPLSEDENQVNEWLTNQPILLEERAKLSYDSLSEALKEYILQLENEGEEEEEVEEETNEPESIMGGNDFLSETKNFSRKETPKDKFKDMFN